MNATAIAVDLAKNVFQLAVADAQWRVVESHRLSRAQFERWFASRDVSLVIMEACGSTHHWACWVDCTGGTTHFYRHETESAFDDSDSTIARSDSPVHSFRAPRFWGTQEQNSQSTCLTEVFRLPMVA